jgi:DNA-directed RNA polymerase subunit RPC12/RpoP
MDDQRCPSCGAEVPRETGQHADTPSAGVVTCPSCGAKVTLDKPGAEPEAAEAPPGDVPAAADAPPGQATGEDAFAGEETVEGAMDEVREKESE